MNNVFINIAGSNANRYGNKIAYIELKGNNEVKSIKYSSLHAEIIKLGEKLLECKLTGKVFILYFPAGIDSIIVFMACFYAGVIPILRTYPPNLDVERLKFQLDSILKEVNQVAGIISTTNIIKIIRRCFDKNIIYNINIDNLGGICIVQFSDNHSKTYIFNTNFIQLTSGSTNASRGVKISFKNLLYNISSCKRLWDVDSNSITVTWTPHSHIFGLITGILLPLYTGGTSVIMQPSDFSKDPLLWIENISNYRATHSGAPNFAYEMCTFHYSESRMQNIELKSWQVAITGGEIDKEVTLNNFCAKFQKHGFNLNKFCTSYGMSENSGVVCSVKKSNILRRCVANRQEFIANRIREVKIKNENSLIFLSVGKPSYGTEIIIANLITLEPLPENEIGEILINSPSLSEGYVNDLDNYKQYVDMNINGIYRKFFRTGDIGFMRLGYLFITGRTKEIIIINGKNYSPNDIEENAKKVIMSKILGLNAAFSVEINNNEVVILFQEVNEVVSIKLLTEIQKQIKEKIKLILNIELYDIVFLKKGDIVLTPSGKIQRMECKRQYLDKTKFAYLSSQHIKTIN